MPGVFQPSIHVENSALISQEMLKELILCPKVQTMSVIANCDVMFIFVYKETQVWMVRDVR